MPLGKISKALAIALTLWCAGAGCVLVSYARTAAINCAETGVSESIESTSREMASSHESCHAKRNGKNRKAAIATPAVTNTLAQFRTPAPARSGAMSCCPLTSGLILSASRVQPNDNHGDAPAADASTDLELFSALSAPLDVPLRLPNQNQTYLRCCVFLI